MRDMAMGHIVLDLIKIRLIGDDVQTTGRN